MAAPDTSSYVLATPDSVNLPNSRTLAASGGLDAPNSGPNSITITTVGNLSNLNTFNTAGFVAYDSSNQIFIPKTLAAGTGIAITNPDGNVGDTAISVLPNTSLQRVQVQKGGVFVGERAAINFIPGPNTSITAGDAPLDGRIDIEIGTSTSFAPEISTYILQTPDAALPNSQALSTLSTGLMKVTTGTGVISTAVANTDYQSADANLTSISAVTPTLGTLLEGDGVGFTGISIGAAGNTWTSNGTQGFWSATSGFTVTIVPALTLAVTLSNKTIYVPTSTTGVVVFTLPVGAPGDVFEIRGFGSSGWKIAQLAGQTIRFGSVSTTTGVAGDLSSTSRWDAITITQVTATEFIATNPFGNPIAA